MSSADSGGMFQHLTHYENLHEPQEPFRNDTDPFQDGIVHRVPRPQRTDDDGVVRHGVSLQSVRKDLLFIVRPLPDPDVDKGGGSIFKHDCNIKQYN
ncbi:hypothetical protein T11_5 [Trichinella zimbabwensis]|uniref:Uncharacterized protein n=1 Tax=Trichinella zimbabwensis TaxID=268475 RepID=A0A0V1GT99_9BILA|nr:hypothetical protein T11_5 [Trichinella zimbabwensis]